MTITRQQFTGRPLIVAFICNHCPYVKHIAPTLAKCTSLYSKQGVAVVLVNSNDVDNYPEDHPDRMVEEVQERGYAVPYVFDSSQDVARAFGAACTPDFFLYDNNHQLRYRGRFDDSRPGGKPTGNDLSAAVDAVLSGREPPHQKPSIGCNIKWKP